MARVRFVVRLLACVALLAIHAGLASSACAQSAAIAELETEAKASPNAGRPNVVFIMADDLGYGDLGCYGQKKFHTPRIDQLAAQGLRFSDFYAGSTVCAPSRCVLMTGLHTGHAFIRGNGRQDLPDSVLTVAEVFKEQGYVTGMFGKWGLGEQDTGLPARQGFDEFLGYLNQGHAHNYYPTHLFRGDGERVPLHNVVPNEKPNGAGVARLRVDYSQEIIADAALRFLEQHRQQPFFLYLPWTLPHANNEAGNKGMEVPVVGEFAERSWAAPEQGFAAMVKLLDTDVGRVLDKLEELELKDNTIVIFTSDNGPHAEGGHKPDFFDSNGELRGSKRSLYEGGIRVPMIIRYPGKTSAGSTTDHIGYLADVLPTVRDWIGAKPAEREAAGDGISFAPIVAGNAEEQRQHDYLYWEFYEQGSRQAVRAGRWKAIREPMLTGEIQLFDLKADLGEKQDIAAGHPDVVQQLQAMMDEAHVSSPDWKVPAPKE